MEKLNNILKEIEGLTTLELAELLKAAEDKFGIQAASGSVAAPGAVSGAGSAAVEEKSSFKVELISIDDSQKIKAIKVLRNFKKDLGLIDAKKAIEGTPYVVFEDAKKDQAEEIKKSFEEVGAKVNLS